MMVFEVPSLFLSAMVVLQILATDGGAYGKHAGHQRYAEIDIRTAVKTMAP